MSSSAHCCRWTLTYVRPPLGPQTLGCDNCRSHQQAACYIAKELIDSSQPLGRSGGVQRNMAASLQDLVGIKLFRPQKLAVPKVFLARPPTSPFMGNLTTTVLTFPKPYTFNPFGKPFRQLFLPWLLYCKNSED